MSKTYTLLQGSKLLCTLHEVCMMVPYLYASLYVFFVYVLVSILWLLLRSRNIGKNLNNKLQLSDFIKFQINDGDTLK